MQAYVIGWEITTVLKTAVDNAILQLCHLCDFFAGALIKWCGVYSNEWIIIFFAVLDKKAELSSSFVEASSEIGPKIKSLQAKQRTCKDNVIGREITTY